MVKIGMDTRAPMDKTGTKFAMRGDAEYLRADVDYALEMLGTDYIDIIVLCRVPQDVSIQERFRNSLLDTYIYKYIHTNIYTYMHKMLH